MNADALTFGPWLQRSRQALRFAVFEQGNLAEAEAFLRESVIALQAQDDDVFMVGGVEHLARIDAARGSLQRATLLLGAMTARRAAIPLTMSPATRRQWYDRTLAYLQSQLGSDAFAAAWQVGEGMSMEHAVTFALGQDSISRGLEALS